MSLTEDEKYALLANVPYQLHSGVPHNLVEEELRLYGLDHEIDRELSDNYGAVLHNDDELIHAVRGTDPLHGHDIISDLGIGFQSEAGATLLKAIGIHGAINYELGSKFLAETMEGLENLNIYKNWNKNIEQFDATSDAELSLDTKEQFKNVLLKEITGDESEPYIEMPSPDDYFTDEEQDRLQRSKYGKILGKELGKKLAKYSGMVSAGLGATYFMKEIGKFLPESRIQREVNRFNQAKDKHPTKTPSFTGHSLGGIVNLLGRANNIKTITFNPAPQQHSTLIGTPHKDSKVYRIKGDIVSDKGIRTQQDTEPVITRDPKDTYNRSPAFLFSHLLGNFIPEKPKLSIEKVLYSPFNYRPVKYDNKRVSQVFDYCKEYPYLTECSGRREKQYY
jgi:hypothetical protein